ALLAWRKDFPILARTTYLISNSLGAMPAATFDSLREYGEVWSGRGVRAWAEGWWELPVKLGDSIGAIIGAPPGSTSMHQNVTLMQAIVLSCFDFSGSKTGIVYTDMQFPSVHYLYSQMKPAHAKLVLVKSPDGITVPTDRVVDAIDDSTLLVPISHVLFRSAYIQDVQAIIEKAHRVGAYVVLDAYQSAGTVPFDVTALGVDFVLGGALKWLCGGPGACFLYVRPDLARKLRPRLTGWQAHPRPFEFEVGDMEWRDDGFRFLNGTPNIPALYAARAGIDIIQAVGVDRIREKSMRQTARLMATAEAAGYRVTAPRDPERRGGTVAFDCPNAYEVSRELLARDILVDYRRGAGIRVSPHFYTTDDECDRAVSEIGIILGEGSWERHRTRTSPVT
ncbi:MAG: aminotransferase class V-fold PLP-dependent enzyme, partial [Micropepsaceae bacterium]